VNGNMITKVRTKSQVKKITFLFPRQNFFTQNSKCGGASSLKAETSLSFLVLVLFLIFPASQGRGDLPMVGGLSDITGRPLQSFLSSGVDGAHSQKGLCLPPATSPSLIFAVVTENIKYLKPEVVHETRTFAISPRVMISPILFLWKGRPKAALPVSRKNFPTENSNNYGTSRVFVSFSEGLKRV